MLVSPFTFYRGAAISWPPTSPTPRSGLNVQLCGDAHLSNFGVFASPSARWSSTSTTSTRPPGPLEWDLKRLAASFEIAGRDRGFSAKRAPSDRHGRVARVPDRMRSPPGMRNLDVWYAHIESERMLERSGRGRQEGAQGAEANVAKARTRDSMQAFSKLTHRRRASAGSSATRP